MQVSHRVYPKIPAESDLQSISSRFAGYHQNAVQVQGSRDIGRKHDAGSCAPVVKYTTKDECVKLYGVLEREERVADL